MSNYPNLLGVRMAVRERGSGWKSTRQGRGLLGD
jgi:hypothetical protein